MISQATRILRIYSDPATAQTRCIELIEHPVRRRHGRRRAQQELQRAIDAYGNTQEHIDCGEYLIVQYHPGLLNIKTNINNFLPILNTLQRMRLVLLCPPVVLFSQPKNLSQLLCRAKLQEPLKEVIQSIPCHGNRRKPSTAFVSANCVTSTSKGRTFNSCNQGTIFNSTWAVYMIMRDVCGMQYDGQTNKIRSRMNGHRSYYR